MRKRGICGGWPAGTYADVLVLWPVLLGLLDQYEHDASNTHRLSSLILNSFRLFLSFPNATRGHRRRHGEHGKRDTS